MSTSLYVKFQALDLGPNAAPVEAASGGSPDLSEHCAKSLVQNSLLISERISDKFLGSKFAACMRPVDEVQHWAT